MLFCMTTRPVAQVEGTLSVIGDAMRRAPGKRDTRVSLTGCSSFASLRSWTQRRVAVTCVQRRLVSARLSAARSVYSQSRAAWRSGPSIDTLEEICLNGCPPPLRLEAQVPR